MPPEQNERSPLLSSNGQNGQAEERGVDHKVVKFEEDDEEHPRNWPRWRKLANVGIISFMAILSPLTSSAFTPAIPAIAKELDVESTAVIGATTSFVVLLGLGPLILAPLSETFGRKPLYMICFTIFTLLQIPTALSPNLETLLAMRALAGFFGSVGIANGGGTISDMYDPSERAGVFGAYLLGPVLGPTLGPLLGGIIVQFLSWRWIFWIIAILGVIITLSGLLFLRESYAPTILNNRKARLEKEHQEKYPDKPKPEYSYEGEDTRPIWTKVATSSYRPLRILFLQPIVLTMGAYQAIIWACNYSLYTQFEPIWGQGYGFESYQVGLMYLPLGVGFLTSAWFVIPRIDDVYNYLSKQHNGKGRPEFRLPLANIGAVLLPICLFAFAWMVELHLHWTLILILVPFGLGQVTIFNATQNYYIDAFEKYAASAIAAGALFRSIIGGISPLFMPSLIERFGYGWGISLFGFLTLALAPSPALFYYYGAWLRERFAIEL